MQEKIKSPKKWYHKGTQRIKLTDKDIIPEGFELGYGPRDNYPWNKGLKASQDERVKSNTDKAHAKRKLNNTYIAWNKGLTKEIDSRVKGLSGELNPMYGKHPNAWNKGLSKDNNASLNKMSESRKGQASWNKGLTHLDDPRIKCNPRSEETKQKISQSHSTISCKNKRFETMKKNNNLGIQQDTKAELDIMSKLLEKYDADDIIHPYYDKYRYPYLCDFYIKSADLFIEVHGNWTHGKEAFDPNNKKHLKILDQWKEKSKTSNYYKNAIYTWTILDVKKANLAKQNNLNFKVIYYKYNTENKL
jgi:hypothetical protein